MSFNIKRGIGSVMLTVLVAGGVALTAAAPATADVEAQAGPVVKAAVQGDRVQGPFVTRTKAPELSGIEWSSWLSSPATGTHGVGPTNVFGNGTQTAPPAFTQTEIAAADDLEGLFVMNPPADGSYGLWSWMTGTITKSDVPGGADTVRIPVPGTSGQIRILSSVPGHPGNPGTCLESPTNFTLRDPLRAVPCDSPNSTVTVTADGVIYSADGQNYVVGGTWWNVNYLLDAGPDHLALDSFTQPAPVLTAQILSLDSANRTATIRGQGAPGAAVTITGDGVSRTVDADASGVWEVVINGLSVGENTLTVTTDGAEPVLLTLIVEELEIPVAPAVAASVLFLTIGAVGFRRRVGNHRAAQAATL